MADLRKDALSLQYSDSFSIQGIQEANVDLKLTAAPDAAGTVYGTVTDGTNPVPGATVKLFDSQGVPFKHTMTEDSGAYSMDGIPAGTYHVGVVKNGCRMSETVGITLSGGSTAQVNLTCTADTTLALGAIAGVLTVGDGDTHRALSGAKISLLDQTGTAVAATYTAEDGEFTFYDVADGAYTMTATADGYAPAATSVTITNGAIANVTMTMVTDSRTYHGTVSGVIRNGAGTSVAGCFVGLYQITGERAHATERLLAVTKTNGEGKYLFGEVAAGQYVVKAKLDQ